MFFFVFLGVSVIYLNLFDIGQRNEILLGGEIIAYMKTGMTDQENIIYKIKYLLYNK